MMIILQTNVIVSNFFAQVASRFRWDTIPSPRHLLPTSSLPITLHCRQARLFFRHVFPIGTHAVCSFAILDKTRFFAPENQLDNTRTIWVQIPACIGNTPGPIWTTENRGDYPGRKSWSIAAGQLCGKNWLFVFPSSIFVKNIVKYSIFALPAVYNDQNYSERLLRRFWSVSRASLWRESSRSFTRPLYCLVQKVS